MPAEPDAIDLAVALVDAADDKKATDPLLLEVADVLAVVDIFLLATAASDRQLRAVAEAIEERGREHGRRPQQREGRPDSGWMLLDFGDVVVHLFSDEQREFYELERLWADVPRIDVTTGERTPAAVGAPSADEA